MSIENIKESITFLEEALNSNIFEFKNKDIKYRKILTYLSKKNLKKETDGNISDDEKEIMSDTESTYVPSELIEVTPIKFPSELYEIETDETNGTVFL